MNHTLRGIRSKTKTATCAICGPTDILWRSDRKQWRCGKRRRALAASSPNRMSRGGIRKSELKTSCEICGTSKHLGGDHCHKTNRYRGTLCRTCNSALGFLNDNKALLLKAIAYLEK